MRQRTALLAAAAITGFVVVLAAGLAGQVASSAPPAAISTSGAAAPPSQIAAGQERARSAQPPPQAATATPGGQISRAQAIELARAALGGGAARKVELERERGRAVYEVTLAPGGTVYVDAASGQVAYPRATGGGSGREREHEDGD